MVARFHGTAVRSFAGWKRDFKRVHRDYRYANVSEWPDSRSRFGWFAVGQPAACPRSLAALGGAHDRKPGERDSTTRLRSSASRVIRFVRRADFWNTVAAPRPTPYQP